MKKEFTIQKLGKCVFESPLKLSDRAGGKVTDYVTARDKVLIDVTLKNFVEFQKKGEAPPALEKAGPRKKLFFDPPKTKAAIVTCGGLCPGLNDVIRGLVMELHYRYRVKKIAGIQYGYAGFIPRYNHPVIKLTPQRVRDIHLFGGSVLGSSRGDQNISEIVDSLCRLKVDILFCIGGDGTLKGARDITKEISRRKLRIAVAGIPKTIDNDINYTERSFGFDSAFSLASRIIRCAHNEAKGAYNGIALLKLMGRDSGYVAAHAALSIQEVNFVLIPEMKFGLYGKNGFLKVLKKRLIKRKHAVIVVAEGAGQFLFKQEEFKRDVSGNIIYRDIGLYLKKVIAAYFKQDKFPVTIKYIDPSYIIRSIPANPNDSEFCDQLARNAVHGAIAGKTGFMVGRWNRQFIYVPIHLAVRTRKRISLSGKLWYSVLEATGQPVCMK